MLILALDTTSEWGGVAIFRDEECLAESLHWGAPNYSVALFNAVETVLHATAIDLKQIELYAVANGPGSFTGIRTGLAAALGWSKACDRPAQGVSILDALVEQAAPLSDFALPLIDARRREFYGGVFRRAMAELPADPRVRANGESRRFSLYREAFVLGPAPLASLIESTLHGAGNLTCVVREHDAAALELRNSLPVRVEWLIVRGHLLAAVARLARTAQLEDGSRSSQTLEARYIRRTDAEAHWQD